MTNHPVTYQGIVYPWHCDHMGHINVMWYVNMFDQAGWQLIATIGLPASRLHKLHRSMAAVQQDVTYHRELYPGDAVRVSTEVVAIRQRTLQLHHRMHTGPIDDIAAEMVVVAVYLDTTQRKAVAFPPDVVEQARALGHGADPTAAGGPLAVLAKA